MKNLRYKKFFLLCFWGSGIAIAQSVDLVNKGSVYIESDTRVEVFGDFHNTSEKAEWNNAGETFFYGDFHNTLGAQWYNDGEASFYGDFLNESMVESNNENSEIRFEGLKVQAIKGDGLTYFKNLVLNNASAARPFQLYSEIFVEGEVTFNQGIVDNANYGGVFYFAEGASHVEVDDDSHVNGPVRRSGTSEFIFPIGDKNHYGYAILSKSAAPALYEAQYFQKNSDFLYSHASKTESIQTIDTAQYWTIEMREDGSEMMLSLPWNKNITSAALLEKPESIHIVRWDDVQGLWVSQGGAIDPDRGLVSTLVSELGVFALATVKVEETLPCELVVYNAITPNSDGNNDYFLIEQEGGNGNCYQKMGVQIFDKWGVRVFETSDYGFGKSGGVFNGQYSVDGRIKKEKLKTGNYFYILDVSYIDSRGNVKNYNKTGYLYLKDE